MPKQADAEPTDPQRSQSKAVASSSKTVDDKSQHLSPHKSKETRLNPTVNLIHKKKATDTAQTDHNTSPRDSRNKDAKRQPKATASSSKVVDIESHHFSQQQNNQIRPNPTVSLIRKKRAPETDLADQGVSPPKVIRRHIPQNVQPFSPKMTRNRLAEKNKRLENNVAIESNRLKPTTSSNSQTINAKSKSRTAIPQLDGADDIATKKKSVKQPPARAAKRPKAAKKESSYDEDEEDEESSSSEFESSPVKRVKRPTPVQNLKKKTSQKSSGKTIDRRVLSSDDEDLEQSIKAKPNATNFWPEVFSEKEDKWVAVDLLKCKVDAVDSISVS